jgi:hypothetical protein
VIPAEAVEAAHKAWREQAAQDGSIFEYNLRAALEAAAPYMMAEATDDALRAAWDKGYATATDGMKDVPANAWDEGYQSGVQDERPGRTKNPFR